MNEIHRHELEVAFGGHSLSVPWFTVTGAADGPHAFVSGGMHGNEINGVVAVRKVLDACLAGGPLAKIRGQLTVIPVLNPSGFRKMQRYVAEDGKDLNRSFGIPNPTTLSEHLALELTEKIFRDCRFGIDLHDAGGSAALLPHCRVHTCDPSGCEAWTTSIGRLLGTRIIVQREGNEHMLATYLAKEHGIPVITVELGGAQQVFPRFQQDVLDGIVNILRGADMLPGEIRPPGRQFYLRDRYGIRVPEACEIQFSVQLGDSVHAGDKLGEIYYPLEHRAQPIVSPMCGFIFSLWQLNQAPAGQTIYSVLEHDECHTPRTTTEHFTELQPLDVHRIRM